MGKVLPKLEVNSNSIHIIETKLRLSFMDFSGIL